MITSPDNEKLKLVRKLGQKKHREKLGLFVTEGEDLAAAGLVAGHEPKALLVYPDSEIEGEAVEPELLDRVSTLASGTKVIGIWPEVWAEEAKDVCVFLDGLADPGNMGTIIRTVDALLDATVVVGPGSVDPYAPISVRASMGSIFTQPILRGKIDVTPKPRIAMLASGGEWPNGHAAPVTIVLGSERAGIQHVVLNQCDETWTIPLREGRAESLNVAAAAAIACERISSPAPAGESS
ncbi:MAG: RNA methyltransferase [Solirubrobacterales bacterium]|nr:RNA methyltransferase [Solirubrobacterales bacterium]